ncbi:hypothetical protein BJ741DRAFT_106065 [Chytriomyces cf. hyalinus JEL632]|nr:hypothetical protein BJ741DRAFT_106065 [Chytriomyces cf. hyalinus JEL632]
MDEHPRLVDGERGLVSMGCYSSRDQESVVLDGSLGVGVAAACLDHCAGVSSYNVLALLRVASDVERGKAETGFMCACAANITDMIKTDDRTCDATCADESRMPCGALLVSEPGNPDQSELTVTVSVYSRFLDYSTTETGCLPWYFTSEMHLPMRRFSLPHRTNLFPSIMSLPGQCLSICVGATKINSKMFAMISSNPFGLSIPSFECVCVALPDHLLHKLRIYSLDQSECNSSCDASGLVCGSSWSGAYSLYSLPPPYSSPTIQRTTNGPTGSETGQPIVQTPPILQTSDSTPDPTKTRSTLAKPVLPSASTNSPTTIAPISSRTQSSQTLGTSTVTTVPTRPESTSISITATIPTATLAPQLNAILPNDTPENNEDIIATRVSGTIVTLKPSKPAPTVILQSPSPSVVAAERGPSNGASSVTTAAIASSIGILLVAFLLIANITAIHVRKDRRKSEQVTAKTLHDAIQSNTADTHTNTPLASMYYPAHRPTAITADSTPRALNAPPPQEQSFSNLSFLEGPVAVGRVSSQYYTSSPSMPRLLALNYDASLPGKGRQSLLSNTERKSAGGGSRYHSFGGGANTQLGTMQEVPEGREFYSGIENDETHQAYNLLTVYRSGILARESETSLVSSMNSSTQLGTRSPNGELKKSESSVFMDVLSGNDELEQHWL